MKKTNSSSANNLIGPMVRKIRLSQRTPVTQEDLAGRLAARGIKVDQSAIARIERGERYVLDYEALAIAQAFRVPIERLYGKK